MPKNGSNWLHPGHDIEEATADGVSETRANNHYNFKSDFEAMREIQDFEQENISMSQPTLDQNPLGTNTTNVIMLPIDLCPVRTKLPQLTPLELPTEFPERNRKAHVPGDLKSDPYLSDSSSKKKKRDKKKKCRKHKKDNSSDSSSSNNADLSYDSDYRRKRRKSNSDWEKSLIKLCARLTAKLLTNSV